MSRMTAFIWSRLNPSGFIRRMTRIFSTSASV